MGAMKWDLWNPWATFYELNSTHPLTAKRLLHLSRQSEEFGEEPYITFNLSKPESYWDEFIPSQIAMGKEGGLPLDINFIVRGQSSSLVDKELHRSLKVKLFTLGKTPNLL